MGKVRSRGYMGKIQGYMGKVRSRGYMGKVRSRGTWVR